MERVILTGGSDGLGKAFAEICIENNIEIISLSRSKPIYPCVHIKTDLSKEDEIINAANIIKAQYLNFNAIVNCAGLISEQKPEAITYDELDNLIKVNTLAPIFLTSQLFDLVKQNEADILNVGSTVGTKAYTSQCAYGASKWALRGVSQNLQVELAKTRCRVIQFNPGGMVTDFFNKYDGRDFGPTDDWMQPKDVADVMYYTLNLPKQLEVSEIMINRKKK